MRGLIRIKNEYFINMHFEQVFNTLFMDCHVTPYGQRHYTTRKKGIYQSELEQNTIEYICNSINILNKDSIIYFYMGYITELKDNAGTVLLDLIRQLGRNNRLIFFKVSDSVNGKLQEIKDKAVQDNCFVTIINDIKESEKLEKRLLNMAYDRIKDSIRSSCEDFGKSSPSSRVRLSKYINVKRMMEDMSTFCVAIYTLAFKLLNENVFNLQDPWNNKDKVLLASAMNGVTISTLLSQLFELDMIKIDHLGPYNELFLNSFNRSVNRNKEYYTVSDVICMGREISDAKAVLQLFGTKYAGSIALVNIIPIGEKEQDIHSLIDIDKENNFIGYSIETDLSEANH